MKYKKDIIFILLRLHLIYFLAFLAAFFLGEAAFFLVAFFFFGEAAFFLAAAFFFGEAFFFLGAAFFLAAAAFLAGFFFLAAAFFLVAAAFRAFFLAAAAFFLAAWAAFFFLAAAAFLALAALAAAAFFRRADSSGLILMDPFKPVPVAATRTPFSRRAFKLLLMAGLLVIPWASRAEMSFLVEAPDRDLRVVLRRFSMAGAIGAAFFGWSFLGSRSSGFFWLEPLRRPLG